METKFKDLLVKHGNYQKKKRKLQDPKEFAFKISEASYPRQIKEA